MHLLSIIVLAVVQGITEFLPISSSGHLVILEELFDGRHSSVKQTQLALNIFLHLGTLLAVVAFYWRPLLRLLTADRRVIGLLFVGTLPAAIIGILIKWYFPSLATNALLSGLMLPLTGLMLLGSVRILPGEMTYRDMGWRRALGVGMAQAIAVLPGISRSGSTIVAGLCLGLRRDEAATFSFLLSVPVIGGATLLESWDLVRHGSLSISGQQLVLGVGISFVVGIAALAWLLKWLRDGRLHLFAWWCFAVGAGVIAWQLSLGMGPPETSTLAP